MAKILSCTLGPYGGSTMIDQGTNYCITKDGFHVLSNLRFADPKQNRIKSTLFSISHQMVTKVGDGSTSAVIAAFKFLTEMLDLENDTHVRPKILNERIQNIVKDICDQLSKEATIVTDKNLEKVVYNITNIATNENATYTNMIRDIYKQLGPNCNINIEDSITMEDSVRYEEGIYGTEYYLIDRIYHNKNNNCVMNNCAVLMYDHTMDAEFWDMFVSAFNNICYSTRKTLIVISPFYEQYLMDKIRKDLESYVKTYANQSQVPFRIVFLKSNLTKPVQKLMYKDLAALLGATIYQPADTRVWFEEFNKYKITCQEANAKGETRAPEFPQSLIDSLKEHVGFCDNAIMGDKISSFKGFSNKNEALFNQMYYDAKMALSDEENRVLQTDSIDNKLIDARTRFIKIDCKSATIEVGGANRLEMSINRDAVDDAVKAAASAIKYGYNQGCNLAIISIIDRMLSNELEELDRNILTSLRRAFLGVYKTILMNGMDEDAADKVIAKSISEGYICYDLARDNYDNEDRIINSCRTDIEILKGAIAMVAVVLTCNQYVSTTLNN